MQIRFMPGLAHYNGYSLRTTSPPDTNPAPRDNYMAVTVERANNSPEYRISHLEGEQVVADLLDAAQHGRDVVAQAVEEGKQWFLELNPKARQRKVLIPLDLLV